MIKEEFKEVRFRVLPCVAVCCSVLQCVTVYCSVLHCVAACAECGYVRNLNIFRFKRRIARTRTDTPTRAYIDT